MIFLLNKPKGISSFNFINNYKKNNNIKKIGHSGTLDPLASGLLLIATDEDTKLLGYIDNLDNKTYLVEMIFGYATDTYDLEGKITNSKIWDNKPNIEKLNILINKFIYEYKEQVPPIFSAKKINGKKAYELARENKTVDIKSTKVNINAWKIQSYLPQENKLIISLEVNKGFYVRSFVNDLGIFFNTYATMTNLNREKIGKLSLEDVNKNLNIIDLLNKYVKYNINFDQLKRLLNGFTIDIENKYKDNSEIILIFENEVIGIGYFINKQIKVKKLFGNKIEEKLVNKNENN